MHIDNVIFLILSKNAYTKFSAVPGQLIGIRYFSCSSIHASDMGFNYVFPTSGEQREDKPFCPVLTDAFSLTMPHYIHEYPDIQHCQKALILDSDVKHI